jgi:hypothetical protein
MMMVEHSRGRMTMTMTSTMIMTSTMTTTTIEASRRGEHRREVPPVIPRNLHPKAMIGMKSINKLQMVLTNTQL